MLSIIVTIILILHSSHGQIQRKSLVQSKSLADDDDFYSKVSAENYFKYETGTSDGKQTEEKHSEGQENKDVVYIGNCLRGFEEALAMEEFLITAEDKFEEILNRKLNRVEKQDNQFEITALSKPPEFNNNSFSFQHSSKINGLLYQEEILDDDLLTTMKNVSISNMAESENIININKMGKLLEAGIKHRFSGKSMLQTMIKQLQSLKNKGSVVSSDSKVIFRLSSQQKLDLTDFIPLQGLNKLKIKFISFHRSNYTLFIKMEPIAKWTIIPNFMSINDVNISLKVQLNSLKTTLHINTCGYWIVGNVIVRITFDYDHNSGSTSLIAHPHSGATSLSNFVKTLVGLSLPVNPSINLRFDIRGSIFPNGTISLILRYAKEKYKFFVIYNKLLKSSEPIKAIAVEVRRFRLSTIMQRILKKDFTHAPFFGKLVVPDLGLIFSTGQMVIEGKNVFKESPLLSTTKNFISKGLSMFIKVPYHQDPMIAKYKNGVLLITTPRKNLQLKRIIYHLLSHKEDTKKVSVPIQGFHQVFQLHVESIIVSKHNITTAVAFPKPIVFFKKFLKLSKARVEICIFNTIPRVKLTMAGKIYLAGATFNAKISQNEQKKFSLSAIGDEFNLERVMKAFKASILPRNLHRFLRSIPFLKVSVTRPRIYYTFGKKPLLIHLGGKPVIHGFKTVNIDLLLLRTYGKLNAIIAIELGKIDFSGILTRITGFNFRYFPILSQRINSILIISPITSYQVRFSSGKLASLPIHKGISFRAPMKFPRKCGSDKFCKYAGRLIGQDTVIRLHVSIQSTTNFYISASIHKRLGLGKGLTFTKCSLEIVAGGSSRISLVGEVTLNKPRLIFTARITVGMKGLFLQLSIANCWYRAFGVPWLSICNLIGAIGFVPPTGISSISFGAEIHLGYQSSGHQMKAKGYFGLSMVDPLKNYYYVKFSRITMGSWLKAFKIKWRLPRPLAESGFPRGFLSSFSVKGIKLPEIRVIVPAGFRLKATLNILGLQGSVDITINLPKLIDFNVALPPIRIGKLLSMYMSSSNRRRGPFLKVKVQSMPSFRVHMEARGYLKVLGISIETRLKISNSEYELFVRGMILHLFEASMHITARYRSIRNAHFRVRGEFKVDLFRGLKRIVTNLFRGIARVAREVWKIAKRAIQKFVKLWRKAKQAVHWAWNKLKRFARRLFFAKMLQLHSNRSLERALAQGWWKRTVKKVSRAFRRAVKKIARGIKKGYDYLVDKAKKLFAWAKRVYNKAKRILTYYARKLAKSLNFFKWVKKAFKVGLRVFNFIRRHGIGGIVRVRRLWFDVGLGSASLGRFAGGVNVQFLGVINVNLRISFDLRKIVNMAKHLFHKLLRNIKRILG